MKLGSTLDYIKTVLHLNTWWQMGKRRNLNCLICDMHVTNSLSIFSWKFNDLYCNIDLCVCVCRCATVRVFVCGVCATVLHLHVCNMLLCFCMFTWLICCCTLYQQITRSLWEQSRKVGGSTDHIITGRIRCSGKTSPSTRQLDGSNI